MPLPHGITASAKIRAKLDHPIIDADGHIVELTPLIQEYITQVGGRKMADAYLKAPSIRDFYLQGNVARSGDDRRDRWSTMGHWWSQPVNTLDRATVGLPRLLAERLDDFGVDFTTLYPSEGLFIAGIKDPDLRHCCVRAYNTYAADVLGEFPDRMTGVAIIPMETPLEAIEELEYAVNVLGLKSAVFSSTVPRPIDKVSRENPDMSSIAPRMELFALDSEYDYDSVWAKCVELKVAVTFHGGIGGGSSQSYSNYTFNHIQGLAKGNSQMCKALFMGGVTRRFPTLKFAFLEGGVGWAVQLFADLL
ncbi:amidohydrolase, partial [Dehalococcoidia bacterium]|nr:amidohydrolase [Dehalococcoidia bacterium]